MALTFDSVTAAELAACTDKISWGNALIAALGTTRLATYKRAASGDAWAAGTTFYAATLTGTMVVQAGKVRTFGTTASVATKLSADLSTGVSVVRFANNSNSARWMQGTLGLTGSGADFTLRRSPSGAYGFAHATVKTTAPAALAAAPDIQLTTLTLRNTTGVTQSANFIAPFFGHTFKQGDVPVSTYPHFRTAGGNACPATLHSFTTWPDGSMKFCGVMMRVPESIAGNGTLTISVRSGGNAPAAGTRTTADLTAPDIKTEIVITDPVEGTFTTSLNDGLTVGDDVSLYANGPAGAIWRIGAFARDSGGVAHGQLYCWHYVAAMTNSSGGLYGLRYLGKVAQPWTDVSTPTARMRDVTCVLKSGNTVLRSMQGHKDSETPGSTIRLNANASFFTADTSGKWDFIQGGGSGTADAMSGIQVVPNISYAMLSGVVPNSARSGAPVNGAVSYYPFGRGQMLRYMPNTGGRSDLGLITLWDVNYLSNQSAQNEQTCRVHGMSVGGWKTMYRRQSTRRIVPVAAVRPSYTGLGTTQETWRIYESNNGFGHATPNTSLWVEDTGHRPNCLLLPYVLTGEPQFVDLMHDNCATIEAGLTPGTRIMNNAYPLTNLVVPGYGERDARVGLDGPVRKGAGFAFIQGRYGAWTSRDMYVGALMSPDVTPGGTGETDYLRDIANNIHNVLYDYSTRMPAPHIEDGTWTMWDNGPEAPWQMSFWNHVQCWGSNAFRTPEAIAARKYMLVHYVKSLQKFDAGCLISYRQEYKDDTETMVRLDDMVFGLYRELTFNTTTNRMTVSPPRNGTNDAGPFTLQNGDIFCFTNELDLQSPNPFPQFGWHKRFYAVNVSGNSCQLATTRGGSPLPMTVNTPVYAFYAQFHTMDLASSFSPDGEYTMQHAGALRYHKYLGDTGAAEALAIYDPKAIAKGQTPSTVSQYNFAEA